MTNEKGRGETSAVAITIRLALFFVAASLAVSYIAGNVRLILPPYYPFSPP